MTKDLREQIYRAIKDTACHRCKTEFMPSEADCRFNGCEKTYKKQADAVMKIISKEYGQKA